MIEFNSSVPFTVGIELEAQLVDKVSYSLKDIADCIISGTEVTSGEIHPEFLSSMVEFVTPPCSCVDEAISKLSEVVFGAVEVARKNNAFVVCLGTHPLADPRGVSFTGNDRYTKLLEELQIVLRKFLIYGLHVHVGFADVYSAIKAFNFSLNYLPLFVCISSSSPFFSMEFTGLHSYRLKIFEMLPRAGIPAYIDSFESFCDLIDAFVRSGVINSLKDVWWDVRFRPDLGTVELRVCDSIPSFNRIKAIAMFFQAMCLYSQFCKDERLPAELLSQNKWNAIRHSFGGRFITMSYVKTIREVALELIKDMELSGVFKYLDVDLKLIKDYVMKEPLSALMIKAYKSGSSIGEFVRYGVVGEVGCVGWR